MATANKQPQSAAAGTTAAGKSKTVKGLRIVARTEGFRRIGRAFSAEPVEIPLSELKDDQVKALANERELVVVAVDIVVGDVEGEDAAQPA